MSKDGRGRKEHELKKICRERIDVRNALFQLALSMSRMTDLVEHIVSNGINVKTETIKVKTISVPTLTKILGEHGHSRRQGRPKAASWVNNPQAIKIVADVLRNHGLHKGREKLLEEGIDYKNESGENEHYSFVGGNGKKLLSMTTLKEIAKSNGITFAVGPKSSASTSSVIENRYEEDEDEEEEEDEDKDEDEDDDSSDDDEEDEEDELDDGLDDEDDEEFDDDDEEEDDE